MQPIEYDFWLSKMDSKVVPELVVFQTPPEPAPTYQTLGLVGSTAMSAIRPDIKAGPILLNGSAEIKPELILESALEDDGSWPIANVADKRHKMIEGMNAFSMNGLR